MQVCRTPLALPAAPQPPAMQAGRQRGGHIALREVAMRSFQPDEEFFFSDVPGVASLLERDRKTIDLNEDALAAFVDEPAVLRGISGKNAEITSAEHKDEEELEEQQGLAGKRDDKLKDASSTPKRAREAINQGLQKFQQKNYRGAIDLFQLALELPGSGFMRLSGSVKEYSCASEGEENAALYNMCCAWAALGEKQSALTVLEALLENDFNDYNAIRTDPDLASLQGPDLDKLLAKNTGLLAKMFGKKKESTSNKPWVQW